MSFHIRPARDDDASSAIEVLRRSITELCHADHHDDPAELSEWLANKSVETWQVWVNHPDAAVLVAENDRAICGVGMVRSDGEVLLNYVSPETRFQGVSRAMLSALEDEAVKRGATSATLESTLTARRFYSECGYVPGTAANPLRMSRLLAG